MSIVIVHFSLLSGAQSAVWQLTFLFFVHFYITHHIYSLIFSCWYDQVVLSNFMWVAVYVIVEWKNETRNREFFLDHFVIALISLIRQRTVLSIGWSLCIFQSLLILGGKYFFRGCTSRLDNLFSEDSDFLFLPIFFVTGKKKNKTKKMVSHDF